MGKDHGLGDVIEDLLRAAEGGLPAPDVDRLRERLADAIATLEHRFRPSRSPRIQLWAMGVAFGLGLGATATMILWRSRRQLRDRLGELARSRPELGRAIDAAREAVEQAVGELPPDMATVRRALERAQAAMQRAIELIVERDPGNRA